MKTVVGIDPGITTAIAVFDLQGNLIEVFSKKGMNKAEVVRKILERGSPVVITCDKKRVPGMIEEIAHALNIMVFSPEEDLKVREKVELSRDYRVGNAHERDAVASCAYFFKKYRRKFNEIDKTLERMGLKAHAERVKEMILLGRARNLSDAIEKITGNEAMDVRRKLEEGRKERERVEKEERTKALERSYEIAREYIEKLERRLKQVEEQRARLQKERSEENAELRMKVMKEREIELRDRIIENLRKELEEERRKRKFLEEKMEILEEERAIEAQGLLPVVRIPKFTQEEIFKVKEKYRIYNRFVLVEGTGKSKTAAKYLANLKPRGVIGDFSPEVLEIFEHAGIAVAPAKKVRNELSEFRHFFAAEREKMEKIFSEERKSRFAGWLEAYKKRFL